MKEFTSTQPMTDEDYKAEIARMFEKLERDHQEMQASQARIEENRAATRTHLDSIRQILDELEAART